MILEESIWKEDLTILLQKIIGFIFLQSMLLISQLHSQLQSFKGSSFRSSIWALEEVGCWFLQRKLGRNWGKSSWEKSSSLSSKSALLQEVAFFRIVAYLNGRNAVQECTTFPCLRAVIWKHPRGARRAQVHGVQPLCSSISFLNLPFELQPCSTSRSLLHNKTTYLQSTCGQQILQRNTSNGPKRFK